MHAQPELCYLASLQTAQNHGLCRACTGSFKRAGWSAQGQPRQYSSGLWALSPLLHRVQVSLCWLCPPSTWLATRKSSSSPACIARCNDYHSLLLLVVWIATCGKILLGPAGLVWHIQHADMLHTHAVKHYI